MRLAVWIWQSQAWTQPQSALSKFWLDVQGLALMVPLVVLAIVLARKR